jgi:hypothetical protein
MSRLAFPNPTADSLGTRDIHVSYRTRSHLLSFNLSQCSPIVISGVACDDIELSRTAERADHVHLTSGSKEDYTSLLRNKHAIKLVHIKCAHESHGMASITLIYCTDLAGAGGTQTSPPGHPWSKQVRFIRVSLLTQTIGHLTKPSMIGLLHWHTHCNSFAVTDQPRPMTATSAFYNTC